MIDYVLDKYTITCPKCNSANIKLGGTTTTLVGFFGLDLNHKWTGCDCENCGFEFNLESSGFNYWITDRERNVLRGQPNCCSNQYKYPVGYIHADPQYINSSYLELSDHIEHQLSPQKLRDLYIYKGEVAREKAIRERMVLSGEKPKPFLIYENVGIGIVNPRAKDV